MDRASPSNAASTTHAPQQLAEASAAIAASPPIADVVGAPQSIETDSEAAAASPPIPAEVDPPLSPSEQQAIISLADQCLAPEAEAAEQQPSPEELRAMVHLTEQYVESHSPQQRPAENEAIIALAEQFIATLAPQEMPTEHRAIIALAHHFVTSRSTQISPVEQRAIIALAEQYVAMQSPQERPAEHQAIIALAHHFVASCPPQEMASAEQNITTRSPDVGERIEEDLQSEMKQESALVEEPVLSTLPVEAAPAPAETTPAPGEIAPGSPVELLPPKQLDMDVEAPEPSFLPTVVPTGVSPDIVRVPPPEPLAAQSAVQTDHVADALHAIPPLSIPSDLDDYTFHSPAPLPAIGPSGFPESGRVELRPIGSTVSPPFSGSSRAWSEFEQDLLQQTPYAERPDSARAERALRRLVGGDPDYLPSIPIRRPDAPEPTALPGPPQRLQSPRSRSRSPRSYSANNYTPVAGPSYLCPAASPLGTPSMPMAQQQQQQPMRVLSSFTTLDPSTSAPSGAFQARLPWEQSDQHLGQQLPQPQYMPVQRIELVMSHHHNFPTVQQPPTRFYRSLEDEPAPRSSPTFDSPRQSSGPRRSPPRSSSSPRSPPKGDLTRTTFFL